MTRLKIAEQCEDCGKETLERYRARCNGCDTARLELEAEIALLQTYPFLKGEE